jgi:hypothetical protein
MREELKSKEKQKGDMEKTRKQFTVPSPAPEVGIPKGTNMK